MRVYPEIKQMREEVSNFRKSSEKFHEFMVNCDLKDRIPYIYKVIFSDMGKYLFYFHFFMSRLAYYIDYSPLKILIYRSIGMKIGKRVFISPQVYIDMHFPSLISIEDDVILGYGASLFVHDFISKKYRMGRIHIKQGAVIGGFVKIGCGVCIGKEANIQVNRIVLKDVPDYFISGNSNEQ